MNDGPQSLNASDRQPESASSGGRFSNIDELYDLLPLGVLIYDPQGTIVYANHIFCEFAGFSQDELVGLSFDEQVDVLVPAGQFHKLTSTGAAAPGEIDSPLETTLQTASGESIPVSVQHYLIPGSPGDLAGTVALVRDLRPLYRERSLSRTAQFVLEATSAAVGVVDPEGTIVLANDAAQRILALNEDDLVGQNVCDIFTDVPPQYAFIRRSLTLGETFENVHAVVPFHGRNLELLINCRRMVDDQGHNLGVCTVAADVSELRRLQRVSALGEIAAVLSHELRNPLAVIKGTLQLLARSADERQGRLVSAALDEVQRMDSIIRDVSSVSQGARAQQTVSPLVPVVQRVGQNFRDRVSGTSLSVDLLVPGDINPAVPGISDHQLSQVLSNLLQNAIEAVGTGTGTVTVALREEPERAVIEVSDTGAGIEPGVLPRIFEPFYTTKVAGTGLGLAVCRILIERAGGQLQVQSTPGDGTTFTVTLPIVC